MFHESQSRTQKKKFRNTTAVRTTVTHEVIAITLLTVLAVASITSQQQPALSIEPPQPIVLCAVVITQPTLKDVNSPRP